MGKIPSVILFGTGTCAKRILRKLDQHSCNIVGFIDNDESRWNGRLAGRPIYGPNYLKITDNFDILLIASSYDHEIMKQLRQLQVPPKKILNAYRAIRLGGAPSHPSPMADHHLQNTITRRLFPSVFDHPEPNNYYACNDSFQDPEFTKRLHDFPDYLIGGPDYIRLTTARLLAQELRTNSAEGAIAELGVYRGDFARFLGTIFPIEEFYLFDTFTGFTEDDVEADHKIGNLKPKSGHLSTTSPEIVIGKVPNSNRCKIIQGKFPDSTAGSIITTSFKFVSIDVDLYAPTLEGLKFFFPRMVPGGYIMVHDFNLKYYPGARKAVIEFCKKYNLAVTPVADHFGSAIISKA